MDTSFSCSWDSRAWWLSAGLPLFILAVTAVSILFAYKFAPQPRLRRIMLWLSASQTAVLTIVFAMIAAYAPVQYQILPQEIVVKRLGPDVSIRMDQIVSISAASEDDVGGAVRLWASGGIFGYFGQFQNQSLGRFRAYATRWENSVIVKTEEGEVFVLTPDDAEGFIGAASRHYSPAQSREPK